jgi:hypothetical protein
VNSTALRKIVKYRYAVIADGRNAQAKFTELSLILFQLDQLGFAVRSPIRGSIKQDNRALGSQQVT